MAKREFLQLAHTYSQKKYGVAGWFLSEKLDGMRALWDGGCTRDMPASEVPFANIEKHARFVVQPLATGLWSRYGQVIHAPGWFLDALPPVILDGELYAGRGQFQHVVSTVKRHEPIDSMWAKITYSVFDAPRADEVFADGLINNTNFKKTFKDVVSKVAVLDQPLRFSGFASRYKWLLALRQRFGFQVETWQLHVQYQLPFKTSDALLAIDKELDEIVMLGGEGVILKSPSNLWVPERCHTMLKHKAIHDAEGTVTGYTWGRETDKGSKLLGLMGALIIQQDNGRRLELSGFTDEERQMAWNPSYKGSWAGFNLEETIQEYGSRHPGQECTENVKNLMFPRGSRITYKYRELTDDGVAKEARYWRKA